MLRVVAGLGDVGEPPPVGNAPAFVQHASFDDSAAWGGNPNLNFPVTCQAGATLLLIGTMEASAALRTTSCTDNVDGAAGWVNFYSARGANGRQIHGHYKLNAPAGVTTLIPNSNGSMSILQTSIIELGPGSFTPGDLSSFIDENDVATVYHADAAGLSIPVPATVIAAAVGGQTWGTIGTSPGFTKLPLQAQSNRSNHQYQENYTPSGERAPFTVTTPRESHGIMIGFRAP